MASYPSSVKAFTTKVGGAGNYVYASHVNDMQDEIAALEGGLLNGLEHHLKANITNTYDLGTTSVRWRDLYLSSNIDIEGLSTHYIGTGGTGENAILLRNTTAGTANLASMKIVNDAGTVGLLAGFSSTYTTVARYTANGVLLEGLLAGGLDIAATHASGAVKFYAGGTTLKASLGPTQFQTTFEDGGVWLRNSSSGVVECHIRAGSGHKGYITFTEDTVADRWSIGLDNGDPNLYFRLGAYNGTSLAFLSAAGHLVLAGKATAPNQPFALAYVSAANTAVATGTSVAAVSLTAEAYDTATLHSTSSNQSRLTVPSDGDGVYLILGQASWEGNATGVRYAQIVQGGSTRLASSEVVPASSVPMSQQIHAIVYMVATNYVELHVAQSSGGNLNLLGNDKANTHLAMIKLW